MKQIRHRTCVLMLNKVISVFLNVIFTGIGYCFIVKDTSGSPNVENTFLSALSIAIWDSPFAIAF